MNNNFNLTQENDCPFREGDIVRHFKWETDTPENIRRYLYKIIGFAQHTETNEKLVIYESAIYPPHKIFARPYDMFISQVDHNKYPNIKQKFRLEVVNESNYLSHLD